LSYDLSFHLSIVPWEVLLSAHLDLSNVVV
jgi:hypothetical protein